MSAISHFLISCAKTIKVKITKCVEKRKSEVYFSQVERNGLSQTREYWCSIPLPYTPPPHPKNCNVLFFYIRSILSVIQIHFVGNKKNHDCDSRFLCHLRQTAKVKCGKSPPRRNRSVIQLMSLLHDTAQSHMS